MSYSFQMASPVRKRLSHAICPGNPEHVLLRSSLAANPDEPKACDKCKQGEADGVQMAASCAICDVDYCAVCLASFGSDTVLRFDAARLTAARRLREGSRRCSFAAGTSNAGDEEEEDDA